MSGAVRRPTLEAVKPETVNSHGPTVTNHLVPFSVIKNSLHLGPITDAADIVAIPYSALLDLVKKLIRASAFDEQWYRRTYPDVAAAINAGLYKSGKQHFVENGYFEGRRPFEAVVDEAWYLATYADVAEGIEVGEFKSAQHHFSEHGYAEGRFPSEY
jgi:hypothetical protein